MQCLCLPSHRRQLPTPSDWCCQLVMIISLIPPQIGSKNSPFKVANIFSNNCTWSWKCDFARYNNFEHIENLCSKTINFNEDERMSNECYNNLHLSGDKTQIDEFMNLITYRDNQYRDSVLRSNYIDCRGMVTKSKGLKIKK